jgi:hypothetical protein
MTPDSPPVQRKTEEHLSTEASPSGEAQLPSYEARPAAEVEPIPSATIREVGQETSLKPEPVSSRSQVQRQVEADQPTAGLEQDILARTVQRAQLPLNKPHLSAGRVEGVQEDSDTEVSGQPTREATYDRVTLTKPLAQAARLRVPQTHVQMQLEDETTKPEGPEPGQPPFAEPLARPSLYRQPFSAGAEATSAGAYSPYIQRSELPLPPVGRPVPAEAQSQGGEMSAEMMAASVVQRTDEGTPETAGEGSETDLDQLARQVYPLIKRMLAVERERRSAR